MVLRIASSSFSEDVHTSFCFLCNLANLTATTALLIFHHILCVGFCSLLVSYCRFHDLSFPYDICGSMVLVNEPVFAVVSLVPRRSHSALSCSSCNLTTIVCWSFHCEILHSIFIYLFIYMRCTLGWIGHIASLWTSFSVSFLHYVQCFYDGVITSFVVGLCVTTCHLLALLFVITIWVHVAVCTSATWLCPFDVCEHDYRYVLVPLL